MSESQLVSKRRWQADDGLHLDVRGLPCPDPMVEILGAIDRGDAGQAFIVHIDQEPLMLYPQLDERGWSHELLNSGGSEPGAAGVLLSLRHSGV